MWTESQVNVKSGKKHTCCQSRQERTSADVIMPIKYKASCHCTVLDSYRIIFQGMLTVVLIMSFVVFLSIWSCVHTPDEYDITVTTCVDITFARVFFFFEWKDLLLLTSLFLPDKLRKTFTAGKIEHNDFNAFENSQGEDWWSLCTVCANSRLPWLPQHRREYQEQKHQYENFRIIISGCTRTSQPTVWSPEKMETVTSDSSSWEIKLVARNDGISGSKPSEVKQSSAACLTQSIPFDTSTGSDGAWGFCTTGVHFVISTALPYAIHVDHIVKT